MSGKDAELGYIDNKLEKLEQDAIMLEQLALLQHHLLWSSEQSP